MRREAVERLLPAVFQRAATPGGALSALLAVMELMHAPSEARLAAVDDLFAPYRTPAEFVPMLARWLAWEHLLPGTEAGGDQPLAVPVGRLRDLVAEGSVLAQWRGTATGLRMVIETVTGVPGFVVEEPAHQPFHIVVRMPPAASGMAELVRRIVDAEKPAAVTSAIVDAPGAARPGGKEGSR